MIIELQDLHFSYADSADAAVLNIPSWSMSEHTFLHGPSGCGKSTLLNIIAGVLPGYLGMVKVLGEPLQNKKAFQLDRFRAQHIGYVFQQFNLIGHLSAIDNVRVAQHLGNKKSANALQAVKDSLLNLGLSLAECQQPVHNLSIGQQQRVAIARAMINRPQLLIADEPTSSLDRASTEVFMQQLFATANQFQSSILFVSHDMSLADFFPHVSSLASINQR